MESWFAERDNPAPGKAGDEFPGLGRRIALASQACCCPAMPAVTVIMPATTARRHPVDLLLCGHHYRASQAALRAVGATAYDSSGTLIMAVITGAATCREPAPRGTPQATR
jgi:hypothetical protein